MKTTEQAIEELCHAASRIKEVADWLAEQLPAQEETVTLAQVRAVLAEKTRAGFGTQVRELLLKYGAPRLPDIAPAHYAALLKDAEGLTHAT